MQISGRGQWTTSSSISRTGPPPWNTVGERNQRARSASSTVADSKYRELGCDKFSRQSGSQLTSCVLSLAPRYAKGRHCSKRRRKIVGEMAEWSKALCSGAFSSSAVFGRGFESHSRQERISFLPSLLFALIRCKRTSEKHWLHLKWMEEWWCEMFDDQEWRRVHHVE